MRPRRVSVVAKIFARLAAGVPVGAEPELTLASLDVFGSITS